MPIPWHKRKERVKLWEQRNKEYGRLPYWNDRARYINYNAKTQYYRTDIVTGQELKTLYETAGRACYYCKESLKPAQVHFDHMDPLKNGGLNSINNLCIACYECNLSKGDDSINDFLKRVYNTQTPERIYIKLYA